MASGLRAGRLAVGLILGVLALSRLLAPYDIGIYEANCWAPAQILWSGENPYDLSHAVRPPFTVTTYGPLFYVLLGPGLMMFGLQLWFGRLLSLGGLFLALWGVHRLACRLGEGREAGRLAMVALAAQVPVQAWVGGQRPDLPALGLMFAGLAWAGRAAEGDRRAALVAALLLAGAFHCRQTSVLGAAFAGVWLWSGQGRAAACRFGGAWMACCLMPAALLQWTSDGGYVEQLYLMPASLPKQWNVLRHHLLGLAQGPQSWVLLLGVPLAVGHVLRKPHGMNRRECGGWLLFAGMSLAAACLTASIPGSGPNYFLEACAALSVGLAVGAVGRFPREQGLILTVLLAGAAFTGFRAGRGEYLRWRALPYQREVVQTVARLTRPGDVIYSDYPEIAVAAGRTYYVNTIAPYDGRLPRLRGVPDAAFQREEVRMLVGRFLSAAPGYHLHRPQPTPPAGVYPLYIHVRSP